MRIFIERFVLTILASFVVLLAAVNPIGFNWPLRIISIIGIIIVAAIAAYFAGWDEWRWSRLSGVWWFWWIFGLSGGASLVMLWLAPFLHPPPSVKWMSALMAVGALPPADLTLNFANLTTQEQEIGQKIDKMTKENAGLAQSPNKQLRDLVAKDNELDRERQQALATAIDYLHAQLKSGALLAKAYDEGKQKEVEIPTEEWEYLEFRMQGPRFKEIGVAGGAGRQLTGVLLGKPTE